MISRASMKQQMKGNKMPDYKTKGGGKISTKKSISKIGQKLLGMKNVKKKPVIKKNIGKMLETFSPAYSIMKGKGLTAEMLGMAKPKPMAAPLTKEQREAQAQQQIMANKKGTSNRMTPMTGMMAGGPVKRKRSIDGCAMKGKTRAM